jgi:hypothetical protein
MSGRGGTTPTWLDDHREDFGMYQGGGWDKGAGSARTFQGGSVNVGPVVSMPSSRDLPPRRRTPRPLGHRHLFVAGDETSAGSYTGRDCLLCTAREILPAPPP